MKKMLLASIMILSTNMSFASATFKMMYQCKTLRPSGLAHKIAIFAVLRSGNRTDVPG